MTDRITSDDTIIALASGAGRAGVAVLRVSGVMAGPILAALTSSDDDLRASLFEMFHVKQSEQFRLTESDLIRQLPSLHLPDPRRASVRQIRTCDLVCPEFLDEALILWMPGPSTFTGEDVVELQVHGGRAIVEGVLDSALSTGWCRLADPGEFTRRAFENGKLDLAQAEAVGDLIDADSDGQRRQAARVYRGEASEMFEGWRTELVTAMASLEAGIDFPDEEDIPADVSGRAIPVIDSLIERIEVALGDWDRARSVREGFQVAILGKPNAGKSSLLNRLAKREAAIVTSTPGTTRDVVEVGLVLGGYPVTLSDTAGLRETDDAVEAEGVRRARGLAEAADLRIWVLDGSDADTDSQIVSRETSFIEGDLIVWNKSDLKHPTEVQITQLGDVAVLSVSTDDGVDAFEKRLERLVVARLDSDEPSLITRRRHHDLVREALVQLQRARTIALDGLDVELVSEDLRMAARALGRVTGHVDVEDLLDRIFSDFCVGK